MEQYEEYDELLAKAAVNSPDYDDEEEDENEASSSPSLWTVAAFMRTRLGC